MNLNTLFIEPEGSINTSERQSASHLRRAFKASKHVDSATLTITACGVYKAYLNGRSVSDQVFTPGFTYYHKRLQLQRYDITSLIRHGENVIGVILGDGWYRGQIGHDSRNNVYGEKTSLLAVLEMHYKDGTRDILTTDDRWKATQDGPIRMNDLKGGEVYDANRELTGWNEPGYDDESWHQTYPSSYPGDLVGSEGEKVQEHEIFTPVVLQTPDGSTVLDFGQNIFGYIEFTVRGKRGQTVRLVHGETLDERGNFTLKNLTVLKIRKIKKAFQEVTYTLKDGAQTHKPSFSAFGFRYVKLENWPEEVSPESFKAIAVYSSMKETGHFECSNPLVNQLVSNTRWSQKGNFVDIPTDCPTRERAGWTGDIAAYAETGAYLMDVSKFLAKWLKDVAVQQRKDGCVHSIVPDVKLGIGNGSAGWGDACIIVPYVLYKTYGDKQVLSDQYDSMTRWLDFLQNRAKKTGLLYRFKKNPYKAHTIDTGWHFGEWLEPGHSMVMDSLKAYFIADAEVATAYYAYASKLMSEIAKILGRPEDAANYQELYNNIKEAYRYNFTHDGIVKSKRQCRYVRPIALDLIHEDEKKENAKILNNMIIDNEYKIGTGFLTTQFILNVLTEYGYSDTAYKMVENTEKPSWLYNVKKGATTILEDWEGISEQGVPKNSFNHYAFGTAVKWLFNTVAGISPLEPGYKKVLIKPVPGGSLTHAKCSFNSPEGVIRSEWTLEKDSFELVVSLPTSGEVHLPNGMIHQVEAGAYNFDIKLN